MGEVTEQIILSILNHSRDTNEVNELISAYFETFGVTEQQYKKYDYTKLNSVLLSKGFTSMEQVVAALSAKMAALDSDTSVTPSPSGGGGGGGGNSGSVGTYVPPVKNVDDEMTFTDVDSNAWYYQAVKEMVKSGVISGMSPDTFSPDEPVTREQFTKMLVTALKLSSESENAEFTDVDAGAWYAPYIRTAVAHKIIFGKDDGSFGVGEKLTREDMAVLLVRAASLADIPLRNEFSADFDDYDSVSGYAYEAVGAVAADGILSGMGSGMFMPREICTRAQAAQGIYNLMNR